jgi:polyisoprenoid-binding protein YceI
MMLTAASPVRPYRHSRGLVVALGVILAAMVAAPTPAAAEPRSYKLDPEHTSIGFLVKHIGFAKVLGLFRTVEGSFVFDAEAPSVSAIDVTIQADSVFTANNRRDQHVREADFLWVEKHPTITFKGTGAERTGQRTGKITGDLTVRGVTRPVTLDVVWNKSGDYPFGDGHHAVGISARATIKRSDFDMTYALVGGLVGDEVEIIIEVEGIRQPQ